MEMSTIICRTSIEQQQIGITIVIQTESATTAKHRTTDATRPFGPKIEPYISRHLSSSSIFTTKNT